MIFPSLLWALQKIKAWPEGDGPAGAGETWHSAGLPVNSMRPTPAQMKQQPLFTFIPPPAILPQEKRF
jgi:hypothetical protein